MAEEDKYYVGPMNEGQAQAWFQLGGDTIEKLEPRDISNLQLAMERNPAAFTDAQRAQVRDVAWKMIENVAKGKYKLDPRETNNFRSILDHAPSTMYMDGGKDFETFKDAEQKWFNVERGIEEKSFGERVSEQAKAAQQQFKEGVVNTAHNIKEGAVAVKQHVSDKAKALAAKGKAVNRLRRMQYNRDKAAIKQMFAQAKAKAVEFKNKAAQKVKQGAKTAAEVPFVLAFGVKELAVMGYNAAKNKINGAVNAVKTGINNRVTKVKNKINNGVNKVKNFGKKVWNGTKQAAWMTAYVVASPVILPYKAAKWTYNKIKAGVNWIRNGYKKLKAKALGDPNLVAQDTKNAIKQASNEKKISRLNAQQVTAAWTQLRDVNLFDQYSAGSGAHYNMSGYADKYLDAINSGKVQLTPENAQLAAAWLGISKEVQDKVNHNHVVAKEERNRNVAAQLEQFGIKNPYKTEETKEQESQSQTPPVKEQPKEQEVPAPQPTAEKPKEKEIPPLSQEQDKFVQSQLGILKQLGAENGLKPGDEMYNGLVNMMETGFKEKGLTDEQMGAIREQNPTLFPAKEKPAPTAGREQEQTAPEVKPQTREEKPETRAPEPNNPESYNFAGLTGNEGVGEDLSSPKDSKPAETAARTPDPNNPETFNFAGITGNEGTAGTETQQPSKAQEALNKRKAARTPEQEAKHQEVKKARRILMAQGRLKPTQKPAKVVEMDTNTRNAFVSTHQQKRA